MTRQFRIIVKGRVQGVFFRASTREMAQALKLKGYVKNLANGDVLIEVQGSEEKIRQMIEWCHDGPMMAKVREVFDEEISITSFGGFEIRR